MPIETFAANLKRAGRDRQSAEIGGGTFSPSELLQVARLLTRLPNVLADLKAAEVVLRENRLAGVGNSTIHFALCKVRGAINSLEAE